MKPSRSLRWVGRILLAIVGPLFWLEVVLQVASLFTPKAPSDLDAGAAPAEPSCVLCMGDSFTFGLGAATPAGAYPAQLESRLRDAPPDGRWRVANGGVPSRNSREVLLDLPRAYRRARPRYVAILVGVNDLWSHPERADIHEAAKLPAPAPSWRFEWRTRRFVQLLLSNRRQGGLFGDRPAIGESAAASTPAKESATSTTASTTKSAPERPREIDVCYSTQLVGLWKGVGETMSFAGDGRGRRGASEFRWRIAHAGELEFDRCDGTDPMRVCAKRRGRRLLLNAAGATAPMIFQAIDDPAPPKPAPWEWYREHDRVRAAGDPAAVLAFTRRWIAAQPDEAWAWLDFMGAAQKADRRDLFPFGLAGLERIFKATAACDAVESLEYSYRMDEQIQRAAEFAREQVARFPDSAALHMQLAEDADCASDFETAVREVTTAIELEGDSSADELAFRLRERSRWNQQLGRDVAAASDAILARRAFVDDGLDRQLLMRGDYKEGSFEQAFVETRASDEERATVHRHFAEVREALAGPPATLVDHLVQMAGWVREQGAEPLIVTYPFQGGPIDKAQRVAAKQAGCTLVDVSARFGELLKTHARSDLFVGDGHCNDAGYGIVAEEVERALRRVVH